MLIEELVDKWTPVLNHSDLTEIKDPYRRAVTARLLENQELDGRQAGFGSGGRQK